jgi:hypothetical protein
MFGGGVEFDYGVVEFKDGQAETEVFGNAGFAAGLPAGGEGWCGLGDKDYFTLLFFLARRAGASWPGVAKYRRPSAE